MIFIDGHFENDILTDATSIQNGFCFYKKKWLHVMLK
jgi:hypothetical protein